MNSPNDTHERIRSTAPVESASERSFGIVFFLVFFVIGLWPLLDDREIHWWSMVIAVVILMAAFLWPVALQPMNQLWMKFGLLLHKILNPLILCIIFFLVVSPIGLLMRALGKRPLALEFESQKSSYWIRRDPPGPPAADMKNQF